MPERALGDLSSEELVARAEELRTRHAQLNSEIECLAGLRHAADLLAEQSRRVMDAAMAEERQVVEALACVQFEVKRRQRAVPDGVWDVPTAPARRAVRGRCGDEG